ncbi:hypothetical protein Lser_V15G44289 [Lactuca serriola]
MAPPARLNQLQMQQVRNIVAEEFNNAFNELIPGVTNDIINQVKALRDERLAAIPGGALSAPPIRDSAYYFEKFSKCSPPLWNGESDPVAAKHWVSDVEGAFMTVGCPDQYKVVIAMNQLRKRGKTWWNTITALLNEEEVRAMSWAQFVERFKAQYVPKVEQQRMQQEFMALQQTTESVSDLNAKFLEMLSFCPSFAGNEAWLVSQYTTILRTEIREFVSMQEFPTLSAIMDAARRREIELQTQTKRKANDTSSKTSGDAQKKKKQGGHHSKNCRAHPASAVPQITSAAPVCYHCNETGHKKPECPKLKAGKGSGGTNPAIASSSKGPTMVTRGRAHQMTADEPALIC